MAEPIPVVVASDSTFFPGLLTTVASAILHERTHPLRLHILDGGISDPQWETLSATAAALNPTTLLLRHRLTSSVLAKFSASSELTPMAYARILTPALVPDDFAIYIDSDFLVTKSLSDSLSLLNKGKALSGSGRPYDLTHDCPWGDGSDLTRYPYVNSGFLLLNLEKWRRDRISETLFAFLEKESQNCPNADQTAINWVLRDDLEYFPQIRWNAPSCDYDTGDLKAAPGEINLHFNSGLKPWKRPLPTLSHRIWWLFNELFLPTAQPPNPLFQPRNLLRYVRRWGQNGGAQGKQGPEGSLPAWRAYWKGFQRS